MNKAACLHLHKSLKLKNVDKLVVNHIQNQHLICMKNSIKEILMQNQNLRKLENDLNGIMAVENGFYIFINLLRFF